MYYARMSSYAYRHSHPTTASPSAIWPLYAELANRPKWDPDLVRMTLDGPFATGTRGVMEIASQGPLEFTLEDVQPERGFVDVTSVAGATIRFGHWIERTGEGATLTHVLEIEAEEPLAQQLGAMISADIPDSMSRLAALAEDPA